MNCPVRITKPGAVEWCLLVAGLMLLAVYGGASLYREVGSRLALRDFANAQAAVKAGNQPSREAAIGGGIDFSQWSDKRVRAYQESLLVRRGGPLAVLRFARLNIRVPVFEGTDEFALNRGVGWIQGTARPGDVGNVGIAGHRDGFFRSLKDAVVGDMIEFFTTRTAATYTVDAISIVSPEDVYVLESHGPAELTLVTCYPFYYVGDAPRRFILHAVLRDAPAARGTANRAPSLKPDKSSTAKE